MLLYPHGTVAKFQLCEVRLSRFWSWSACTCFCILQVLKVWQQIRFLTRSWLLGQCDLNLSSTVQDGASRNLSSGQIGQPTDHKVIMYLCSISISHLACTESNNTTIIPRFVVFYDIISAEYIVIQTCNSSQEKLYSPYQAALGDWYHHLFLYHSGIYNEEFTNFDTDRIWTFGYVYYAKIFIPR